MRDGHGAVWELGRKGFRAVLLKQRRVGGVRHLVVRLEGGTGRIEMEKEKGDNR